jgi:DNA-binding protein HU-beta
MALKKPAAAAPTSRPAAKTPAAAKTPKAAAAKSAADKPAAGAKAASPKAASSKAGAATKAVTQTTVSLKQVAAQLGESHGMEKKQAEAVMTGLVELMVEHLKKGDRLRLNGLGILQVRHSAARMGRNPATGASIQIAAKKKIAFRPAKELKDELI